MAIAFSDLFTDDKDNRYLLPWVRMSLAGKSRLSRLSLLAGKAKAIANRALVLRLLAFIRVSTGWPICGYRVSRR